MAAGVVEPIKFFLSHFMNQNLVTVSYAVCAHRRPQNFLRHWGPAPCNLVHMADPPETGFHHLCYGIEFGRLPQN